MRVYLARHGETTWNLAGRYQGRRESALTALGVRQGMALGAAFAPPNGPPIARIVASPLWRCQATARFVADRVDLPIVLDDRLTEIAHGDWEGRLRNEIEGNEVAQYRAWRLNPDSVSFNGGETLRDVQARWRAFADDLARSQGDGDALVCTHDAVVRIALLTMEDRPLDELWEVTVQNAAYAIFDVDGTTWRVVKECENAHLAALHNDTTAQAL
jgi:broad specificity phosphatase PhoE